MSKAGDLKPCPFCKRVPEADDAGWPEYDDCIYQEDNDCFCCSELRLYDVQQWNTRPIETALQEQLKQAEEVIKDLNKYADKKGLSSLVFMQRVINRLEKYKDDKGE